MKKILLLSSLSILFLFIGCSVPALRVNSKPDGAEVALVIQGQSPRQLGKTPLYVVEDSLGLKNEEAVLRVSKEGFAAESVLVPASSIPKNINLYVELSEDKSNLSCKAQDEVVQKVAKNVAEVQSQIKGKEFDQASRTLEVLISQHPNVAVFHSLLGNAYYLKKDLEKALYYYRKASLLDPGNEEMQRIIKKIENIYSSRKVPYGNGGTL